MFHSLDITTVIKLYKTYIRPVWEFANSVFASLHLICDTGLLENAQRRVTRLVDKEHRMRREYSL